MSESKIKKPRKKAEPKFFVKDEFGEWFLAYAAPDIWCAACVAGTRYHVRPTAHAALGDIARFLELEIEKSTDAARTEQYVAHLKRAKTHYLFSIIIGGVGMYSESAEHSARPGK